MINLNLTYEESKKILGLGYDFAPICWHSSYAYRNQYDYSKTFIEAYVHGTRLSLEVIRDRVKCEVDKYGIVGDVTPIIPEAALEACLPEFTTNKAWFSLVKDSYPETRTHYWIFETPKTIPQSDTWDRSPRLLMRYVKKQMLYENLHSAYFKSAYEAFIWCHENYPEELKKKFEEVMK